jgi:hypothetical protein
VNHYLQIYLEKCMNPKHRYSSDTVIQHRLTHKECKPLEESAELAQAQVRALEPVLVLAKVSMLAVEKEMATATVVAVQLEESQELEKELAEVPGGSWRYNPWPPDHPEHLNAYFDNQYNRQGYY